MVHPVFELPHVVGHWRQLCEERVELGQGQVAAVKRIFLKNWKYK
jgi:hypothetical protein